jgi:hypothetical protein
MGLFIRECYEVHMLKRFAVTEAMVIHVWSVGCSGQISYKYFVDGIEYLDDKSITHPSVRRINDQELLEINDLKIKYAIEEPSITEIWDDRIK